MIDFISLSCSSPFVKCQNIKAFKSSEKDFDFAGWTNVSGPLCE